MARGFTRRNFAMSRARLWGLLQWSGQLLVLWIRVEAAAETEENLDPSTLYQPCQHHNPLMNPTHERMFGVDVIWQIPQNPRAIVALFPASGCTPLTFFDHGPNCKLCYGLPEERLITLDALKRGYAVIAVGSFPLSKVTDLTISVLKIWMNEHQLEALQLVLWGQSAGGVISIAIAATLRAPVGAVVPMAALNGGTVVNSTFPPTLFVTLAGNPYEEAIPPTPKFVVMMEEFLRLGISASWINLPPKPLTPFYLAERIHCMSRDMSRKIYEEFLAEGLLDDQKYLTANPLFINLSGIPQRSHALPFCRERNEVCLQPDVRQELQVAYGVHSITSEVNGDIFLWLDRTLDFAAEGAVTGSPGSLTEHAAAG